MIKVKKILNKELEYIIIAKDEDIEDGILIDEDKRIKFITELEAYYEPREKELSKAKKDITVLKRKLTITTKAFEKHVESNSKLRKELKKLETKLKAYGTANSLVKAHTITLYSTIEELKVQLGHEQKKNESMVKRYVTNLWLRNT